MQVVEVDHARVAAVAEARVVLKPVNVDDLATVALALKVGWVFQSVEVEDVGVGVCTGGEKVASIAEPDLAAIFELELMVLFDCAGEHIHHGDFVVAESRQNVEATGVERHSVSLFSDRTLETHFKLFLEVVPDADVALGAGDDELLAQADVHACDLIEVEGSVNVLCLSVLDIRTVECDRDLQQLVVPVDKVEDVLG